MELIWLPSANNLCISKINNLTLDDPSDTLLYENTMNYPIHISKELMKQLLNNGKEHRLFLHALFLETFTILLKRVIGTDEISVITNIPTIRNIKVPVVYKGMLCMNESLKDAVDKTYSYIVDLLTEYDKGKENCFNNIIVLSNYAFEKVRDGDKFVTDIDLSLIYSVHDQAINLSLCCGSESVSNLTASSICDAYILLLKMFIQNPMLSINAALDRIFQKPFNEKGSDMHISFKYDTVIDRLLAQVVTHPTAVVITTTTHHITYEQLWKMIGNLASKLIQDGYGTGDVIAFQLQNPLLVSVAIYAIMSIGAAYLPIDIDSPAEYRSLIMADSHCRILIVDEVNKQVSDEEHKFIIFSIDIDSLLYLNNQYNPVYLPPESLAYIIYTSGTTGRPKGVMIEHRSLLNFVDWRIRQYQVSSNDITLQLLTPAFDGYASNFYMSTLSGGNLVCLNSRERKDIEKIRVMVQKYSITNTSVVPAIYKALLYGLPDGALNSFRFVVLAGETAPLQLLRDSREMYPNIQLINEYGPTECTIASFYNQNLLETATNNIGRPIDNTYFRILNENDQIQIPGLPGELYIGGAGVARGYINDDKLTGTRFVQNPNGTNKILYRTGDRVRLLEDGMIEFLGRTDRQVKVNGYRVDLLEVEKQLCTLEEVHEAAVVEYKGNLYAYVVILMQHHNGGQLKEKLKACMPSYMIPSVITVLSSLPLQISGKVDYSALLEQAMGLKRTDNDLETTRSFSELELQVIGIWKDILKVNSVRLDDNFFFLGGNSLLAAILINRLNKELSLSISLRDFLRNPTVTTITRAGNELPVAFSIVKAPVSEKYPLSSAQKRLFILHQMNPESLNYNISTVIRIKECLSDDRLTESLNELISRHETFRSFYQMVDNEPVQYIYEYVPFVFIIKEMTDNNITSFLSEFIQPFSLDKAPLFRAAIIHIWDETILVFDMHHIILDGSSLLIFLRELFSLYQGGTLATPSYRYMDYIYTQQYYSNSIKDHEEYWLNQFATIPASLDLPLDFPRPAIQTFEGADMDFKLPASVGRALRQMASELECTVFHLLYSALGLLLYIYTGQNDIVIGMIADGRTRPEWENIVGLFVNTLAVRTQPQANKLLSDYVLEVKKAVTEGVLHQDYQYHDLIRSLNIQAESGRNPLLDVMIAFNEFDYTEMKDLPFQYDVLNFENHTTKFDLTLIVNQNEDFITGVFQFATSLFKKSTISRMRDHYIRILTCMPLWKSNKLSSCSILTETEMHHLLYDVQGDNKENKSMVSPVALLDQKAMIFPDRPAVVCDDVSLTYAELNDMSVQIALQLQNFGVAMGDPVAVVCGRSIGFLAAVFGILRLGASYVPIDPAYPEGRIQTMLAESRAAVVISDLDLDNIISKIQPMYLLMIDSVKSVEKGNSKAVTLNTSLQFSEDLPIYQIFTSGSTGTPKLVAVRMRSFLNLLDWYTSNFDFGDDTRALLIASVSFDLAQKNLFASLATGGCLYIYSDSIYNYEKISKLILDEKITSINCTPSAFYPLVESTRKNNYRELSTLRTVFLGGESIDIDRLRDWALGAGRCCRIINTYGPTECTDILTYHVLCKEDYLHTHSVPIGRPIDNVRLYVMDSQQQLAPMGIPGELYAGGIGVSLGYINSDSLNREKFVELPEFPGQKLYRTGDIVRWNDDGLLEFMGRCDRQVKIRGYRIEIEEIEMCIGRFEGISEAVVIVHGEGDDKTLYAYIVVKKGNLLEFGQLRAFLQRYLPSYMIPARFITVDAIPLTVNGKVDRHKLAKIQVNEDLPLETNDVPISSDIESCLIEIWKSVLDVDQVKVTDDFFELGGHSLSVIRLLAKLNEVFPISIDFITFMEYNTIQKMASYYMRSNTSLKTVFIENETNKSSDCQTIIHDSENAYAPFPMNDTQISYMLGRNNIFLLGGVSTHLYMEIITHMDIVRLNRCLNLLILRHPMLRAVFSPDGTQKILENVPDYRIEQIDARQMPVEKVNAILLNEREYMSHRIFPYDQWPLFEVRAIIMSETDARILFGFDAMLGDGYSLQVMAEDLVNIYLNREDKLPALNITYRDYCLAMERYKLTDAYAEDKAYWDEKLASFPPSPAISLLKHPSDIQQPHFDKLTHRVSADQWTALKRCARSMKVTPSAMLCTIYARLLSFWANQKELGLNLTVFNRFPLHPDVDFLVGDFTSILLLDIRLCEDGDLKTDAVAVHTSIMQALEHRHYDGTNVIRELAKAAGCENAAYMPIVFTGALFEDESINLDESNILGKVSYVSTQTSQVYIDNKVYTGLDGSLIIEWDYVRELFCAEDIKQYFDRYIHMIYCVAEEEKPDLRAVLVPLPADMCQITEYNNTKYQHETAFLHSGVTKYASITPDQVAVIDGKCVITYGELERQSNRVAQYLVMNYGAKVGKNIAILTKRNISTIVNMLAILKTGAAYVPIDPEYPTSRVDYIVEHTNCLCTLGDDINISLIAEYEDKPVSQTALPEDNAYVIYTSGSTGVPKGVTVTHASAMNTIFDMVERLNMSNNDKIVGISPINFDLSVFDIFGTFTSGATLVLVKDQRNMDELRSLIIQHGVTIWNSVPAILSIYLASLNRDERQNSVRHVLLSGDWIPLSLPDQAKICFPAASIMSLGGATEASIWSIYYPINQVIADLPSIPYGMPLNNQKIYVLNYWGGLCPVGVSGELYIGGNGLAEGYWNDPEKTEEAFFIHNQFGRLYRTGDFGVLHKEGYIEFLGRRDNQIKLHGHRIELGEIESVISRVYPQVLCTAAIMADTAGTRKICLYIENSSDISTNVVYQNLSDALPQYMIPEHIILIEKLPLTANGKVDRKALPKPQDLTSIAQRDYIAPGNRTEEKLQAIWQEVLNADQMATTESFFEMGGDSLLAIHLVTKIQKSFGVAITYRDIYEHTTIQEQAVLIHTLEKGEYTNIPVTKKQPFYPLSLSQRRFYVLDRIVGNTTAYNLPTAVCISGKIDIPRLETAILTLIQRHDVLRSSFHHLDGEPICIVHEQVEFHLEKLDLHQEDTIEEVLQKCCRSFDLRQAPLFRATIIHAGHNDYVLFFDMHHIISDGISMEHVVEEMLRLYFNVKLEKPVRQYSDYVAWSTSQDSAKILQQQEEFWLDTLKGYGRVDFPVDFKRPNKQSFRGSTLSCTVDSASYSRVKQLCKNMNITLFMFVVAVYALVLHKYTGLEDILIGTPVSGRNHADVQKMIGLFINTLLLRTYPSTNKQIKDFLNEIRDTVLDALSNQEYPLRCW